MSERLPAAFVDKYKIGRNIGEGNFSVVKECTRKADGAKFAVKCINKHALNPKDRSNLAQEISILKEYDNKCDIWSLGVITYILLCGFPPFYDENQVEEMRKILHADFEFVEPYFDGVSSQAKDLIRKMLVVDPDKRLSAQHRALIKCSLSALGSLLLLLLSVQGVLKHPWFSDCKDDDDHVLASVGKKLKEAKMLTSRSKFRAGVGAVMAVNKTQRLLSLKIGRAST
ncbi:hypothetical protein PybrP1_009736 [[Pythium] brassicae (nom. inval.)]|nr:hypothetical protein PybrP1_009736 [[Pythium] brassicae (nom. inval.)]